MGWRLRFADQAVTAVHLLAGDPGLLAVSSASQTVHFFDKATGGAYGLTQLNIPTSPELLGSPAWAEFTACLRAPGGAYLPCVDFGAGTVHTSYDGRVHLFQFLDGRLALDVDGHISPLNHPETNGVFMAAALDRDLGTVGALDDCGWLHLYQQHISMGSYEVCENTAGDHKLILLPDAADRAWIVESVQIQAVNTTGRTLARVATPDASGPASCSPDGQLLAVAEIGSERITVYNIDLQPTWRGSVVDLLANAVSVKLFEESEWTVDTALSVAVDDDGFVAFYWGGWICVTSLAEFAMLPRPRLLL